jgi:hypothetical protein
MSADDWMVLGMVVVTILLLLWFCWWAVRQDGEHSDDGF